MLITLDNKPLDTFSIRSINLVNKKSRKYEVDINAKSNYAVETTIDNSKIASDLNPGIKVMKVDVFEISKNSYAKGKWYSEIDRSKV